MNTKSPPPCRDTVCARARVCVRLVCASCVCAGCARERVVGGGGGGGGQSLGYESFATKRVLGEEKRERERERESGWIVEVEKSVCFGSSLIPRSGVGEEVGVLEGVGLMIPRL